MTWAKAAPSTSTRYVLLYIPKMYNNFSAFRIWYGNLTKGLKVKNNNNLTVISKEFLDFSTFFFL